MNHKKNFSVVLLVVSVLFLTFVNVKDADAERMTDAWRNLLEKRSSSIFTESIDLGGLRVGGRGKITFTWLDRSLLKVLEKDMDVDESVVTGLDYYYGYKPEIAKLIKNRDVFLLSYQAIKRWDFKIEAIVINGYRLTTDDILTHPSFRVLGEIPPFKEREKMVEDEGELDDFQLHVAVPSIPKRGKAILSYEDDSVEWEIPK
ncbi:MAG: hypothetical protein FWE49_00140 [Synergistaceae bacterium]|nr:hypothetical protein [Synergistaceae bacterium]